MVALMPSIRMPSIRCWCIWRGGGIACCARPCCATSRRVRVARVALGGLTGERVAAVVGAAGEPGHGPRQLPHVRGSLGLHEPVGNQAAGRSDPVRPARHGMLHGHDRGRRRPDSAERPREVARMNASTTMTDPAERDPCPSCRSTTSVRPHRHLTERPSVVVRGVPDGLGDRGREPAPVPGVSRRVGGSCGGAVDAAAGDRARGAGTGALRRAGAGPPRGSRQDGPPGVPPRLMTPCVASEAPAGQWWRDAPASPPGGQPVPAGTAW